MALSPGLRSTIAWVLAALAAVASLAAALQCAGCIVDGHSLLQITGWALVALWFGWLTWRNTGRALDLTRSRRLPPSV